MIGGRGRISERRGDRARERDDVDAVRPGEAERPHDDATRARDPTIWAVFHITWLSASADGSRSTGTRLGVIAERVARENPEKPATSAGAQVDAPQRRLARERAGQQQTPRRASGRPGRPRRSLRRSYRSIHDPPNSEAAISGHQLHQPDESHRGRRVRQRVDLQEDRDERDVRPDLGEHLARPQQPEVALAQRRRGRARRDASDRAGGRRTCRTAPRFSRPFHSTFAAAPATFGDVTTRSPRHNEVLR